MKIIKFITLVCLIIIALYFVVDRAFPYFFNFNIEQFDDYYWPNKWWLIGHLSGGITALVLGPFQFSTSFRNRFIKTHRLLGKIFVVAIIIASLSAVYMSFYVAPQVNIAWSISLLVMSLVWLISVLMAYRTIRLRRIPQHKEWMIRTYVITFGFVLFRFLNEASFIQELMPTFEERGATCIWLSWALPLFIAEVILQWNKKK